MRIISQVHFRAALRVQTRSAKVNPSLPSVLTEFDCEVVAVERRCARKLVALSSGRKGN
jgi:hypothetical protein